eukprot:509581_1
MTFIYSLHLALKLLLVFYINTHATDSYKMQQVKCDIVIGGGSTAALSAAITAATAAQLRNESILTCLVEPTDWPGGQLTNEGVSAIDYGKHNSKTQNQPQSFRSLLSIFNRTNPGDCTVSITCFQPQYLLNKWIFPKILNLSLTNHLRIFYNTMIIDTFSKYNPSSITSIKAVQRISLNNSFPWTHLLSEQLTDWYSTQNSKYYNKTILNIEGKIFIEGTEFSDILMTSNINQIYQGVEEPEENSTTTNDQCGAAIVFPFFMKLLSYIPNNPPIVPVGNNEGRGYWLNGWDKAWIFRRALDSKHNGDTQYANINDISQQNMDGGNDFGTGYLYLSVNAAKQQYLNGNWMGGINMTVLKEIEQRAFGWYHFYVNHSYNSSLKFDLRQLIMDVNCTNTSYGLSKFPYIRDTRRSLGLYGFKLYYKYLRNIWNQKSNNSNNKYENDNNDHDIVNKVFIIDPFVGDWKDNELLLRWVNDCRCDIFENIQPTKEDNKYYNVEYVGMKVNGWPQTYLVTKRDIKKGEELMTYYGEKFADAIQEQMTQKNEKKKTKDRIDRDIMKELKCELIKK